MGVGKGRAKKGKNKKVKKQELLKLQEEAYQETLVVVNTAKLNLLYDLLAVVDNTTAPSRPKVITRAQLQEMITSYEEILRPGDKAALAEVDAVVAEKEAGHGDSAAS